MSTFELELLLKTLRYKYNMESIIQKIITSLFFIFYLNGCAQSVAFLGPAVTVVSTGNVYQGGLSYGSNRVFKNLVNKNKKKQNKQEDTKNSDIIFKLVKKNINKNSGVKKLD